MAYGNRGGTVCRQCFPAWRRGQDGRRRFNTHDRLGSRAGDKCRHSRPWIADAPTVPIMVGGPK